MAWYFRNSIPSFFAKSRRRKIVVKRKMYKDLVALNKLPSLKRDCCTFFFVSPLTWREKPRMKGWKFLGGIEKEISAGKISNLTDVMICMRANKAIVPFLQRWGKSTFSTIVKTYQHQKLVPKLNTNQSYVFFVISCASLISIFSKDAKRREKRTNTRWSYCVKVLKAKTFKNWKCKTVNSRRF